MNDDGLLPCPFCGSDQVSKSLGKKGDGTPWPYIECGECSACAELDKWNKRASSADTVLMPVSIEQAAGMAILGEEWLRANAPDRLRPAAPVDADCWPDDLGNLCDGATLADRCRELSDRLVRYDNITSMRERWNIERGPGESLIVCQNQHDKGDNCEDRVYVPEDSAAAARRDSERLDFIGDGRFDGDGTMAYIAGETYSGTDIRDLIDQAQFFAANGVKRD